MLTKLDYQNVVEVLKQAKIDGLDSARYLVGLAERCESRIEHWYDTHVTGFSPDLRSVPKETKKPQ